VSANWTASPGNHELRAVVDPGDTIAESDEGDNYLVREIAVPYPDITLSNLTFAPQNPDPGVPVTLRTVVSNNGPGNTSRSFEVGFYAGGELVASAAIDGLSRGVVRPLSTVWTTKSGTFDISAVADARGDVTELNELNNVAMSRISIPFPDLAVTGLTASPPGARAGDRLDVSASITNNGANDSTPFSVGLYINGTLAQSAFISGITAGQNLTVNFIITLQSDAVVLLAEADFEHAVLELSEANNNLTLLYPNGTVLPPSPAVDLTIKEIRWLPENPVDGEQVTLLATVERSGGSASDPLDLYTGFIIDGQTLANAKVRIIGQESVARLDVHLAPGNHSIQVMADAEQLVTETSRDNNWAFASIEILPADIAVISFAPVVPVAVDGDSVTVFAGMVNRGAGATQTDFAVYFLIDGLLARSLVQKGLPQDANNTVMFSFAATPGVHRLKVIANWGRRLVETDFTNNEAISQVSVDRADISIYVLQAPTTAEEGSQVTISATVRNAGATTVRDFQVNIFVDGIQVGKSTVFGLPAAKSATVTCDWTALAGSHLITVRADTGAAVGELDETNNWMSITAVNISLPDLQMRNISVVRSPVDGAECLVSAELLNTGDTTVRDFMVAFHVDEEQVKGVHLGGVPAGASFMVSESFRIGAGPHLLGVSADPAGSVPELDETNNGASLFLDGTGYPDLRMTGLKVPPVAVDGETVSVFAEVENAGIATAGAFTVGFFVDGTGVADALVEGLPAGGTASVSARWTALPGSHYIRAVADPADSIIEADETDNEIHKQGLNTEQPDIDVSDIACVRGLDRTDPARFRVFATIDDIGGPTLRNIHATVYVDDNPAGDLLIQGLPARSSTQASVIVTASSPHTITVKADEAGILFEGDESNNEASAPFAPVDEITDTFAELVAKELSIAPSVPTDGETVKVFTAISNDGNASLMGDAETILTANGQNVSKAMLHGLMPGAEAIVSFDWTATAGSTRFGLIINPGASAAGVRTDNGAFNASADVLSPDLRAAGLTGWNTTEGLAASMFAVIENNGTGDTVRPFNVNIIIGGFLYAQKKVNGLLSGERLCLGYEWQTMSGQIDIVIWVDPDEKVPESNEGNNRLHDFVYTNYPDITVGSMIWSPNWTPDSPLTLFVEVVNDGVATGRTMHVSLSVDSTVLGLGEVHGMPAYSRAVISWRWTVQPGNHSLSAVTDIYDNVLESNENNNKLVMEFPSGATTFVPVRTNLLAANATFRQSRDASGNLLGLSFTIVNDGLENISSCFALVLVDGMVLSELSVPEMGVNTTYNLTYNWSVGVSSYLVRVIVDNRRQVSEDIETDNDNSMLIQGNIPPIVDASGPYKAYFGDPVVLKGSGHDPDGYITLYEWDLNGDGQFNGPADAGSASSGVMTVVFHKAGLYKVSLRVTDDLGATAVSITTIWIKEKPRQEFIKIDVLTAVLLVIVIAICATVAVMLYRGRGEVFRR
jgi:subtilase family serine protease